MLIATPVGVGSAIYLNEYAKPGKIVTIIEYATETLSGIPSIIFGLFGMMFFGERLGLGYSLLTGSLTLIIMVLPLITRNTQEALKTVPDTYRNGAIGLGSGKWHMIRTILIPSAMPHQLTDGSLLEARIFHRLVHQAKSGFVIGTRFNGKTHTVVRDTVAQLTILKKAR